VSDPVADLLRDYAAALEALARLDAAAEYAENRIGIVEAEQMDTDTAEWKGKAAARSSKEYKDAVDERRRAKEAAGHAKGQVLHIQARLEIFRTRESTRREMIKANTTPRPGG
jgi:hypothetical protein